MKRKQTMKRAVEFRRWARKSYAVFNSLKLVIKICVLTLAYVLVRPAQDVNAQSDSSKMSKATRIEEVEISGQREPAVASQISRIVTVIPKREIEQAPALNVNNLLNQVPQVDLRQRGPNGAQADISIQGGSFDQTLILLNGINLTDPQTGHYNLTLPLDIESVDRIEVLKGPASRVYGTNAFSGAVNFVTGLDTHNHVKAGLTLGDFGLTREALTANMHSSHFTNFISASKGHSNGYIHNTDYNSSNAYYLGKADFNRYDNLMVQLGYGDNAYGANSFYSPESRDQFDHTTTYFASLSGSEGNILNFKPYTYFRRNYDHYEWIRSNPVIYENFHYTDVFGGGINTAYTGSLGKTSLGLDYRKETIYSTSLGKPYYPWKKVPGDTSHYRYTDSRDNISLYLEHNFTLHNFSASLGVMANHNSKLSHWNFYPGMDMSYRIIPALKAYATVNHALRLPTFTDLYYQGPQNVGNPNLKPEQAWSVETGLKFATKGFYGHISYFHRWGTDIIDWIMEQDNKWHTVNYTKLNTDGIEVAANMDPRAYFGSNFFIHHCILSYSFTTLSKNSGTMVSNYALDNLRHKITLGIDHRIYWNIGASWQFLFQKRNGTYQKYEGGNYVNTSYNAFCLLNGKIYYQSKFLRVFAEATNIFNTNYVDLGNISQPGRWFKAGVELNVGWR